MKVMVVDLRSDLGLALKAVESALATAKATERRAATLLVLAKASGCSWRRWRALPTPSCTP